MLSGPLTRTRTSEKKYAKHKKSSTGNNCEFCSFTKKSEQVIDMSKHFWIIRNIFGYDIWDGCGVIDHLMIVPKRHVHSLSELTTIELGEYAVQLAEYEDRGYSVYSRAAENITKSVPHQHTHFIKLDNKRKKGIFYLRKPHVMLYK